METITISVTDEKIEKMKYFYQEFIRDVNNPYLIFSAKVDGCTINLYTSKKCTFQGDNAIDEALIWQDVDENEDISPLIKEEEINFIKPLVKNNEEWQVLCNHIGSDEVGTGDFFGPIIVCACYVKETDISLLKSLKVTDSKKINDEKIREIGKILIEKLTFSCLVCDNLTYNKQIEKGLNMNEIKAILHNRALLNVIKKANLIKPRIIMDEFANAKNYYNYLKNRKDPIVENIEFKTKGETYAPAIACASIIARYRFLEKYDEYSSLYKLGEIPKGASQLVDIFGQLFVKTYGIEKLQEVAKMNFKNVEKILNPLNK